MSSAMTAACPATLQGMKRSKGRNYIVITARLWRVLRGGSVIFLCEWWKHCDLDRICYVVYGYICLYFRLVLKNLFHCAK